MAESLGKVRTMTERPRWIASMDASASGHAKEHYLTFTQAKTIRQWLFPRKPKAGKGPKKRRSQIPGSLSAHERLGLLWLRSPSQ